MGYFLRSINLLNIMLACIVVLMISYVITPLSHKEFRYAPSKAAMKTPDAEEPSPGSEKAASLDYVVIADKNLFHPERRIPPEKPAGDAQPLPQPEFVLYGTTILDEQSIAYIEDKKVPQSTPGRGKRVSILKKGDALSGFVLTGIERDNVIMVRGNEKITVWLNELKERAGGQPSAAGSAPGPGTAAQRPPAGRPPLAAGQRARQAPAARTPTPQR